MKLKLFPDTLKDAYFVFLVPVFFITHEYLESTSGILLPDVLKVIGLHVLYALILFLLLLFLIRSVNKTAICCFFILIFNYAFGPAFDFLKKTFHYPFFIRYSFLIPAVLLALVILILYLKKTERKFVRLTKYLNILFCVLIIIDVIQISIILLKPSKTNIESSATVTCSTCSKPDMYLILADEYAGKEQLQELFKFDNSKFEDSLKAKGFHLIKNATSNYNYTLYSMASMFSMQYLDPIKDLYRRKDINRCFEVINQNHFFDYLKKQGYQIKNLSLFRVDDIPTVTEEAFFFMGTNLLNRQTFIFRAWRDLGYHLTMTKLGQRFLAKSTYSYETDLRNNLLIRRLLLKEAQKIEVPPRFVYAHFIMPHDPFYFNREGKRYTLRESLADTVTLRKRYVEYLQYSNVQFLHLITRILETVKRPTIIIFMSDHGSRLFSKPTEKKYQFSTINAVYIPDKNYDQFYEGISNVNELRVLLNVVFNQNLPLLKDKYFYLESERARF